MGMKRPFLSWTGSKFKLARKIISYFPLRRINAGFPYVGGGAVFAATSRAKMESINDIDEGLTNLYIQLRERPQELVAAIEATMFSPMELRLAQQPTDDPLEWARRFYTKVWLSFRHYEADGRPLSFRRQYDVSSGMTTSVRAFMRTDALYVLAKRLRGVTIENLDALEYIGRYDNENAFFYVDPPYEFASRVAKKAAYEFEIGDPHDTAADEAAHRALAAVLNGMKGTAVVSGYATPLYAELYEANGWERVDFKARINGTRTAVESIWIHPRNQQARLL